MCPHPDNRSGLRFVSPLGSRVVEESLSDHAIDAITRRAADAVSRRNSLLALGGAALAAATMAEPLKAKKTKTRIKKKCRRQVTQCRNYFAGFCLGDPEC